MSGFVDHSEAWCDDNENNIKDVTKVFLDYDSNAQFSAADGLFNGPQCIAGNACGEGTQATLHVCKALVLVMSGSSVLMDTIDTSNTVIFSNHQSVNQSDLSLGSDESLSLRLRFSGSAEQPIASGSQIVIEPSAGTLAGQIEFVMPHTNRPGSIDLSFTLYHDEEESIISTISALITSPSGVESTVLFQVTFY